MIKLLIAQAVEEWGNAPFMEGVQVVDWSPTWKGRPRLYYLAETLAARNDSAEELTKLLSHQNAVVVSYSLLALKLLDDSELNRLPDELLGRTDPILYLRGSFGIEQELGQFAKEIQLQWREKHPEF